MKKLDYDALDEEAYEKHRQAGKILQQVREEGKKLVKKGTLMLDVAEFVENRIRELGGEVAFPCNLSCDADAAHNTPSKDDSSVFDEQMVKLDIGVHVDGYIADSAITIDMSGNRDLKEASENALAAAIEVVAAGVNTADIGKVIEDSITSAGFRPIVNLTGHGLLPYITHAPPPIPNRAVSRGSVLKDGMVIAIEPFATSGVGKVGNIEKTEIYRVVSDKRVRLPAARKLYEQLQEYNTLPFAKRWLEGDMVGMALLNLEKNGIVEKYPVLREVSGEPVSQTEHTMIVHEGGCEVTTG
ncbi:MAG: type II methionyl aminopeptidase [Methermicoccaceae archaeon]